MQLALADIMRDEPSHYHDLPAFYQHKRDLFNKLIQPSKFSFTPGEGTYFQLVDYSAISDMSDVAFCQWLIKEVGVAAIPVSVFCQTPPDMKLVRFCFAKDDATLKHAAERLIAI
jgi:methionine aminotransferase